MRRSKQSEDSGVDGNLLYSTITHELCHKKPRLSYNYLVEVVEVGLGYSWFMLIESLTVIDTLAV